MSLDQLYLLPKNVQQDILNGPALAPPPGVIPNPDNPPNRNDIGLVVTTLSLSASSLALVLATYAKFRCLKQVHLEDFFALSAYGLFLGLCSCSYQSLADAGYFVHQWDVRVKDISHLFYTVHVGSILYAVSIMLFKVAILLQWVRIFVPRGTKDTFYWTSHILLWINVLLYSIIVIVICASCKPYSKLWDNTIPGTCNANRQIIDIATAVGNLILGLIIVLLPQPVIWRLQIKTRQKIGIASVFLVGIFALISAGFRTYASILFYHTVDRTYYISKVALWAISELTCAMVVYCVPSIPTIFKDPKLRLKFPASLVSWLKLPSRKTKSGDRPAWPSYRGEQLPLDNLRKPKNDKGPLVGQYGLEEAKIPGYSGYSRAGVPRTINTWSSYC